MRWLENTTHRDKEQQDHRGGSHWGTKLSLTSTQMTQTAGPMKWIISTGDPVMEVTQKQVCKQLKNTCLQRDGRLKRVMIFN